MVRTALVAALAAASVVTAKPTTSNRKVQQQHATRRNATIPTVHFPLNYKYGGNYKIATAVSVPWSNSTIDVVYDQGSENFWLMAPNATVNWGCQSLACQGACNATETVFYDYEESSTATTEAFSSGYMYGTFDKILLGDIAVNDTLTFVNVAGVESTVPGIEVALENYLQNRIGMSNNSCSVVPEHDVGILGISPYQHYSRRNTTGPHVRKNLLDRGQIGVNVHSFWMDEAPEEYDATFTGGGLMGGIDTSKYTGDLVKIPYLTPELAAQQTTVGYYVSVPKVSVKGTTFNTDTTLSNCFLDSGTHIDDIPIPYDDDDHFFNVSGIAYDPTGRVAWPGNCDTVPADLTIDYTWTGVNANETVTVKVPVKNYIRGNVSPDGWCTLNMSPGGCLLAAPFSTAAFFAADDEREEVALAQGGVSARGSSPDSASIVERIP